MTGVAMAAVALAVIGWAAIRWAEANQRIDNILVAILGTDLPDSKDDEK